MTNYVIIGVVAVVVLFVIVYVKITIDEKKGTNSAEKQKVKDIVKGTVPNSETYTIAYGTREEYSFGGGGRTVTSTTKYWYYGAAFKEGELYLVPLSFDGGDIGGGQPIHYGRGDLGMAEFKNGLLTMYDRDRKEVMNLFVVASNTKEDKYHPVNIQQKEEAEAFAQFAEAFARDINAANGITDIKAAKKEAGKK
ncbi:MAG: hypothetical protein K2G51_03610 [Lachnospiraceae bacterium]|nr:hypothetical protein [Lachnospiraceae bacterium]MDE7275074.1 hypothetical protein [Lachnospiraceae bacterium]